MKKLKQIIYETKLNNVKNNLKKNAERAMEIFESGDNFNGIQYNLEQTRLMICKSYLENKLTYIRN